MMLPQWYIHLVALKHCNGKMATKTIPPKYQGADGLQATLEGLERLDRFIHKVRNTPPNELS